MPDDIRLRITQSPAIQAAVASALGAETAAITADSAVGTQKDRAGIFSWYSPNRATRLQIGFGERYFESSKGKLDRMPPTPPGTTVVTIPGADRSFFITQQGHLEVGGKPENNYVLGVSLSFRDPALPVEQGSFTGAHPEALALTTNIASLIVKEYFAEQ